MGYCDLCDIDSGTVRTVRVSRALLQVWRVTKLLIASSGFARFPSRPHKSDHPDYTQWGELHAPNAWQRLGNGEYLKATGGWEADRVVTARRQDCVAHGPS